jgi:DNA-directed RNA polymerase subunit RPC12/RpoP
MIRFCCEQCGHKLSVPDQIAGKRGKCPKCGNVVFVPNKTATIELHCSNCGRKITLPRIYAGKKGRCPNCKEPVAIPEAKEPVYIQKKEAPDDTATRLVGNDVGLTLLDVPEELKHKNEPGEEYGVTEEVTEQESREKSRAEEAELVRQWNLPWFIDIFLYPFNLSGVIHLIGLWLLIFWVCPFVMAHLGLGIEYIPVVYLLPIAYSLYYFTECIRDSASGGRRAPDLRINTVKSDKWDYISQLITVVGSIAVCFWPVAVYYIVTKQSDLVYWLILGCCGFFFPMVLLAVVLFDSFNAVNPILIVRSIFHSLLPYCGMVLFFYAGALLFVELDSPVNRFWLLPLVPFLLKVVQFYIVFVAVGFLGRFYRRYEDKLNWEV